MIKTVCKQCIELYHHTSSYILFPTGAIRNFWTRNIAQQHGGIALSRFVTFYDICNMLQHQVVTKKTTPFRILTQQESHQLVMELLSDNTVIDILSRIESVDFSSYKKDELMVYYAPKILHVFNTYCLFQTYTEHKNFSHHIGILLQKYAALLESYQCIDRATILLLASQGAFTFDPIAIQVVCPERFVPEERASLQYFHTHGILSEYTDVPVSYASAPHRTDITPTLKVFNNIVQEIEYLCKNISMLLRNGTDAHDIAISVCQLDTDMQIEIQRTAQQYEIPIHLSVYTCPVFSTLLQEVYSSHFHPLSVQKFLSEPSIPWKHRNIHMKIVRCGIKDVHVDAPSLKRWKRVLRNQDEYHNRSEHIDDTRSLLHHFELLQQHITTIITASSYQTLASALRAFMGYFISDESQNPSSWQYIFFDVLNTLQVFEQYIHRGTHICNSIRTVTAWILFRHALDQYHIQPSHRISSVSIYPYPQALGTYYHHHFVMNLNQVSLNTGVSLPTSFSDMLTAQYVNTAITEQYQACNTYIANNIAHTGDTVWISASNTSYKGAQILPVDWKYDTPQDSGIDMWDEEQQFWASSQTVAGDATIQRPSSTLYINDQQKKGLEYQHNIGLGDTRTSMFEHTLPIHTCMMLQTHIIAHGVLHPSALPKAILFPEQYFFESILGAKQYIPNNNFNYLDIREFSSILHQMFQICAEHIIEFQNTHNVADMSANDTFQFHQIIENEIFKKYVEAVQRSSLHSFMKNILLCAFDTRIFVAYIENFIGELHHNEAHIKSIEEDIIVDLSTVHHNKNTFPPFILKGRPDLVCYKPQKESHTIYDYKFYSSQHSDIRKIEQCIQLWAYLLLIQQDDTTLITQEHKDTDINSRVLLYDIVKSIQDKDTDVFFPRFNATNNKENSNGKRAEQQKEKEKEIINSMQHFGDLCADALYQCYQGEFYHPDEFIIEKESELEQIRYMLRQELHTIFSTKVILRDQCYIYPNMARGISHEHQ